MTAQRPPSSRPPEWLFVACGVWLVGLGCYFIFFRPALLPEDLRYAGIDPTLLHMAAPGISDWLHLVFTVMGGFMAAAGGLVAYLAVFVLPLRPKVVMPLMLVTGALSVGLMSAVNFALGSDFRWLLAVPAAVWLAAVLLYVRFRR
jgi:hypothetical protein